MIAIAGTIFTTRWVWGLYIFEALGLGAAWVLSTLLPGLVTAAAEPEIHGRVFGLLHLLWTLAMILGTLLGGELLGEENSLKCVLGRCPKTHFLYLSAPQVSCVDPLSQLDRNHFSANMKHSYSWWTKIFNAKAQRRKDFLIC